MLAASRIHLLATHLEPRTTGQPPWSMAMSDRPLFFMLYQNTAEPLLGGTPTPSRGKTVQPPLVTCKNGQFGGYVEYLATFGSMLADNSLNSCNFRLENWPFLRVFDQFGSILTGNSLILTFSHMNSTQFSYVGLKKA